MQKAEAGPKELASRSTHTCSFTTVVYGVRVVEHQSTPLRPRRARSPHHHHPPHANRMASEGGATTCSGTPCCLGSRSSGRLRVAQKVARRKGVLRRGRGRSFGGWAIVVIYCYHYEATPYSASHGHISHVCSRSPLHRDGAGTLLAVLATWLSISTSLRASSYVKADYLSLTPLWAERLCTAPGWAAYMRSQRGFFLRTLSIPHAVVLS